MVAGAAGVTVFVHVDGPTTVIMVVDDGTITFDVEHPTTPSGPKGSLPNMQVSIRVVYVPFSNLKFFNFKLNAYTLRVSLIKAKHLV